MLVDINRDRICVTMPISSVKGIGTGFAQYVRCNDGRTGARVKTDAVSFDTTSIPTINVVVGSNGLTKSSRKAVEEALRIAIGQCVYYRLRR